MTKMAVLVSTAKCSTIIPGGPGNMITMTMVTKRNFKELPIWNHQIMKISMKGEKKSMKMSLIEKVLLMLISASSQAWRISWSMNQNSDNRKSRRIKHLIIIIPGWKLQCKKAWKLYYHIFQRRNFTTISASSRLSMQLVYYATCTHAITCKDIFPRTRQAYHIYILLSIELFLQLSSAISGQRDWERNTAVVCLWALQGKPQNWLIQLIIIQGTTWCQLAGRGTKERTPTRNIWNRDM